MKLTPTTNDILAGNGMRPDAPMGNGLDLNSTSVLGMSYLPFSDPAGFGPTMEQVRNAQFLDPSKPFTEQTRPQLPPELKGPPGILDEIPLEPKTERPVQVVAANPGLQPLKIAIVGTAPSSRGLAPFSDPSWKIWVCSAGNMNVVPRADAWFELHSTLLSEEYRSWGLPYVKWLNEQTFPIYAIDRTAIPRAIPYPKDEMVNMFGKYFFTSSFAWMMALAIAMGAFEIALYGVDMSSTNEYILQRAGGHFFCCEAQRRGIRVIAPPESDILAPTPLYGFDDATPMGRKFIAREQELTKMLSFHEQNAHNHANMANFLRGALEDVRYTKAVWVASRG